MNLLYFATHQLWPLTTGARLRDYHLARQLAARCSLTFLEMLYPEDREDQRPDTGFTATLSVKKPPAFTLRNIMRGLAGPLPLNVLNFWSQPIAGELEKILKGGTFDVVQLENVQLLPYVSVVQAAPNRPRIVADWHNVESELMRRYAAETTNWPKRMVARRTADLLERAEEMFLNSCAALIVASERERRMLLNRVPSANIHVVPNGVECSYYSPHSLSNTCSNGGRSSKQSLLFVGSMDYHANIDAVTWFAREMWPDIARKHVDLEFVIAGRHPAPEVRALASERIRITGTVEDVRPFYRSALAVIVPLRIGSGTRLKILEAMAAEVPVVSTPLGAEGIEAEENVHLLLASNAKDMISAVDHLIESAVTRASLSQAAKKLAEQYDWSILGERLYRIHCSLLPGSGRCR